MKSVNFGESRSASAESYCFFSGGGSYFKDFDGVIIFIYQGEVFNKEIWDSVRVSEKIYPSLEFCKVRF